MSWCPFSVVLVCGQPGTALLWRKKVLNGDSNFCLQPSRIFCFFNRVFILRKKTRNLELCRPTYMFGSIPAFWCCTDGLLSTGFGWIFNVPEQETDLNPFSPLCLALVHGFNETEKGTSYISFCNPTRLKFMIECQIWFEIMKRRKFGGKLRMFCCSKSPCHCFGQRIPGKFPAVRSGASLLSSGSSLLGHWYTTTDSHKSCCVIFAQVHLPQNAYTCYSTCLC